MNYTGDFLESRICWHCGKEIDILYPNLWRYKRPSMKGRSPYYFCSWSCLRAYDESKKGAIKVRLTKEQKQQAIEMAIAGTSPIKFIESCGVNNPSSSWCTIKKTLQKHDPETAAKIPNFRHPPKQVETPEKIGGLCPPPDEVETPEKVIVCRPIPVKIPVKTPLKLTDFKVTGLGTTAGDFQYYKKSGYLDWTPLNDNAVVSLKVEEWKELLKVLPDVAVVLGVEL